MADKQMTPAQVKALIEAGKWFSDPKLGKQRIKDFGKMIIDSASSMSGAPMNDNRIGIAFVRPNGTTNPGSPLAAAQRQANSRARATNPGSPLAAAQRQANKRAASNPGSPLAAAQRQANSRARAGSPLAAAQRQANSRARAGSPLAAAQRELKNRK